MIDPTFAVNKGIAKRLVRDFEHHLISARLIIAGFAEQSLPISLGRYADMKFAFHTFRNDFEDFDKLRDLVNEEVCRRINAA